MGEPGHPATNPNGLKNDYMAKDPMGVASRISPLLNRFSDFELPSRKFNKIYFPYCTGDAHLGSKVHEFKENDREFNPARKVQHYKGRINIAEAMKYIVINHKNFLKPDRLLITGQSAGSIGATANYTVVRDVLNPNKSALLADSGPILSARRDQNSQNAIEKYPATHFYAATVPLWGLELKGGLIDGLKSDLLTFNPINYSTIYRGLSKIYPQDRFAWMNFQKDGILHKYIYKPYYEKGINTDDLFAKDINLVKEAIDALDGNIGYWLPNTRHVLASHVLTAVTLDLTGIEELKKTLPQSQLKDPDISSRSFIINVTNFANGGNIPRFIELEEGDEDRRTIKTIAIKLVEDLFSSSKELADIYKEWLEASK